MPGGSDSGRDVHRAGDRVAESRHGADPVAVHQAIDPSGFDELPVTGAHAARVAALPPHHRDPFDRLLVAQSEVEGLSLLTANAQLTLYGKSVQFL